MTTTRRVGSKPWRIWTGAPRSSAWWLYGPAYATKAAAVTGVDQRIASGEFVVRSDGDVVTEVFSCPVGVGHIDTPGIEVQRRA